MTVICLQVSLRMRWLFITGLQRATGTTPSYKLALQRSGCSTWQVGWRDKLCTTGQPWASDLLPCSGRRCWRAVPFRQAKNVHDAPKITLGLLKLSDSGWRWCWALHNTDTLD